MFRNLGGVMQLIDYRKYGYRAFFFCVLLLQACAITNSSTKLTTGMLPSSQEMPGWFMDGEPVVCSSLGELSRQINGGAPFYIDRGAKKIIFQDYINTDNTVFISLEIYQTGNNRQAEKLFHDIYVDSPVFLPDIGTKSRIADKLIGVYALDFVKNSMYARMTITKKTDLSREDLERFAQVLSEKF